MRVTLAEHAPANVGAVRLPTFGILKQGGKVYTKLVNDTKAATLMPLITRKIAPDSVVYTDCLAVITH